METTKKIETKSQELATEILEEFTNCYSEEDED